MHSPRGQRRLLVVGAENVIHVTRPGRIRRSGHQRETAFGRAVLLKIDRFGQRFPRRRGVQRPVRPVLIMDVDPPGRVLDHDQNVGLGAVGQVDCEEIAGQDRLGLGAQELPSRRPGPPGSGVDAVRREDLPHGRCRDLDSQAGQLAVDPAVSPSGILPGQPEDQGLDVPAGGRAAGPAALGSGGLAAADDVAVPAHDRVRGDQQPQPSG